MANLLSISIIAFSLTFDTLAVSVGSGVREKEMRFQRGVIIAMIFGILQGLTPVIGWFIGEVIDKLLNKYGYIISVILLIGISIKMLLEALKKGKNKEDLQNLKFWMIVVIGIATSIDAFVVGISIAMLNYDIRLMALITFSLTFLMAMIGMYIG